MVEILGKKEVSDRGSLASVENLFLALFIFCLSFAKGPVVAVCTLQLYRFHSSLCFSDNVSHREKNTLEIMPTSLAQPELKFGNMYFCFLQPQLKSK